MKESHNLPGEGGCEEGSTCATDGGWPVTTAGGDAASQVDADEPLVEEEMEDGALGELLLSLPLPPYANQQVSTQRIEPLRRFVQQQHHRIAHQLNTDREPALLTDVEIFHLLVGHLRQGKIGQHLAYFGAFQITSQLHLAAGRSIRPARDNIEQGTLSTALRAEDGHHLAAVHGQMHSLQHQR
uniref:Uncharacterized protein n=1 Tax=Anopheles coluzzii TaxID=1518534 RepID=A0A8W7Q3N7_ANOCL